MRSRECRYQNGCSRKCRHRWRSLGSCRGRRRSADGLRISSDRGACFRGTVFCLALEHLGVKQRFGAIGKKGSIASWASSTTPISVRIGVSAGRHRQRFTSDDRRHTCPRSRRLAAGWAKARWIHRFASTTSTANAFCPCSFEKQPEGRSPGGNAGRRVRARRHRSDRDTGLCADNARHNSHCGPTLVCARQRASQFSLRPLQRPTAPRKPV